jgi:hypothetical protein
MNDPLGLSDRLRTRYLQYLDSAMPLRVETLARERRCLLEYPVTLFQEPRLEPVPPYAQTETLTDCFPKSALFTHTSATPFGQLATKANI